MAKTSENCGKEDSQVALEPAPEWEWLRVPWEVLFPPEPDVVYTRVLEAVFPPRPWPDVVVEASPKE